MKSGAMEPGIIEIEIVIAGGRSGLTSRRTATLRRLVPLISVPRRAASSFGSSLRGSARARVEFRSHSPQLHLSSQIRRGDQASTSRPNRATPAAAYRVLTSAWIVLHLAPDHASNLAEILSRSAPSQSDSQRRRPAANVGNFRPWRAVNWRSCVGWTRPASPGRSLGDASPQRAASAPCPKAATHDKRHQVSPDPVPPFLRMCITRSAGQ